MNCKEELKNFFVITMLENKYYFFIIQPISDYHGSKRLVIDCELFCHALDE
jgi:hypothetical protein